MQQEDLNRFLQTVRKTRLVDYLEPSGGESAEQALERKLRWAARSRATPSHAAEAAFLLQHGDALRAHLAQASTELVEDEWIEFGGDDESSYGNVGLYSSSSANESIDLDAILGGPDGVVTEQPDDAAPDRQPTMPAATARSIRPAVTSRPRSPTPVPSDRPDRSGRSSPSVLLERARRNSPVPHLGRIGGGRTRNPGTPSPPLLSRRSTPAGLRSGSPRPEPRRWSSGQSSPRVATPSPVSSRPPSYSPPGTPRPGGVRTPGTPLRRPHPDGPLRVPTPAPATPRSPTPGGYDVQITGHTSFLRNNDHYGTSEVVYESEIGHGAPLQTPMPARTPHAHGRHPHGNDGDILGSLRGNVRKGAGAGASKNAIAKKPQGIPVWVYLIPITALVSIICAYIVAISWGIIDNPLAEPPPPPSAPGDAFANGGTVAPIPIPATAPAVADTDLPGDTDDGSTDAATDEAAPAGSSGSASSSGSSGSSRGTSRGSSAGSGSGSRGSGGSSSGNAGSSGAGGSASSGGDSGSGSSGSGTDASGGGSGSGSDASGGEDASGSEADAGAADSTDSSTDADAASQGSDTTTDGAGGDAADSTDGSDATPVPEKPPEPAGIMAGAWNGAIGDQSCVADLTQRGESVRGTITINAEQFQVSGRYNEVKGSIYLTGTSDSNVVFRGTVDGDRVTGKAKLGAGKLYQVWQLRRR